MTHTELSYGIATQGASTLVTLAGDLDFDAHTTFRQLLSDVDMQHPSQPIILRMADVTAIDPAGLGLLLIARKRFQNRGLSLSTPSPEVQYVLTLTGFDSLISTQ